MQHINSILATRQKNGKRALHKFNTINVQGLTEQMMRENENNNLLSTRKNYSKFHDVSAQRDKAKRILEEIEYTKKITGPTMFQNPKEKTPWKLITDNVLEIE